MSLDVLDSPTSKNLETIRQLLREHLTPLEAPLRAALLARREEALQEIEDLAHVQDSKRRVSILIGSQDLLELMDWLMPLVAEE
jgi:hypothetical protein